MTRRLRRTTIILWALIAFLCGLAIARLKMHIDSPWLVLLFSLTLVARKFSRTVFIILVVVSALVAGIWRGSIFMNYLSQYDGLYKQSVVIRATVTQDGTYSKNKQLAYTVRDIRVIEPFASNLVGELSVEGFGANMVYRGDEVLVSGKIYPTRGGKQGTIKFANMQVVSHHESTLEKVRHRFIAGMYTALPEPAASFALGLLMGQRSTLPENVTLALSAAGLTHIVAVSGYNLTIIVRAVRRLRVKKSRYQATVMSLGLIMLFVVLVGSSPSIMRASLVSTLSIIAWYYGRTIRPVLLIALVAALTAGYYPIYLWSDIGWYLSFLAFFGVLVVAPLMMKRITRRKKPHVLLHILVETISAQIMTVPVILYIFGRTSFLSIFSNLLVVPLVPLAMLFAMFAGLAGMIVPLAAGFIALPARFLLMYMLDVAAYFANIPHVIIERTISARQMIYMYIVLVALTTLLWHKNREDGDIIPVRKS